jgi:hypothetical protein
MTQIDTCINENLFVKELSKAKQILTQSYYSAFKIVIINDWKTKKI